MVWAVNGRYQYVLATWNVDEWGSDDDQEGWFLDIMTATSFGIYGHETASTGQKHFQCYFEAPKNFTAAKWQGLLPHAHFERADGSALQNIAYCSKDGEAVQWGNARNEGGKGKGQRNDLKDFVQAVRTGRSDGELFEEHPRAMVMYAGAALRIRSAFAKKRTEMPCIRVLWGLTGTGKSHQALKIDKGQIVKGRHPFLIGYTGQNPCIVFEEFRWEKHDIEDILMITDENCPDVELKGSTIPMNAELIYFLSNKNPKDWWPKALQEQRDAFMRRISDGGGEIRHLTERKYRGVEGQASIYAAFGSTGRSRSRSPSRARSTSPEDPSSSGEDGDTTTCKLCNLLYYPENQEGRCTCGTSLDFSS